MAENFNQQDFNRMVTHPVQSYAWGEFRRANGATVERLVVDGKGFTVTFSPLPLIRKTIGILTQCHMTTKKVIEQLKILGAKHGAISIKVEPYIFHEISQVDTLAEDRGKLTALGLVKSKDLYPAFSFVIDLSKSEDELLSAMKSKTRYNVNLANKKNLKIEISTDDKAFDHYLKLLAETTKRQAFYAHTKTYQQAMWRAMKSAGMAKVITASFDNEVLAAFILFEFGGRLYYPYGASTRSHRELMAPQLLMWEAILYGKKMGYREFEMWGSLGETYDENNSWVGFHRFKAGFGGAHVAYVSAYDLILSPLWYHLYVTIEKLRWLFLKRIK